jgi:hypothetical protein
MGFTAMALMGVVVTTAQSKDPFIGNWTLNVAKSKYSPGPVPKSVTSTYEAAGKGYKVSVKNEPASGPVQQWSYTTNLDGKESRIAGNNPNADAVTVKRIDANTLELVNSKAGKPTTTQTNVVGADGKTRTVTTTGTDGQGQKVNNVAVFERQYISSRFIPLRGRAFFRRFAAFSFQGSPLFLSEATRPRDCSRTARTRAISSAIPRPLRSAVLRAWPP